MQDKAKQDMDASLVDRGWAQMEAQLDAVMPQRKRRPLLYWWFLGLFLIGMLVTSTLLWSSDRHQKLDTPKPVPAVEEAIVPVAVAPQPMNIGDTKPAERLVVIEGQEADAASTKLVASVPSDNNLQNIGKNNASSGLAVENEIIIDTREDLLFTDQTNLENQLPIADAERRFIIAQKLATLELKPAGKITEAPNFQPIAERKPQPKWRYYLEGQAGMTGSDNLNSLAAGFGLERSIGKKWNLNAGLQYQANRLGLLPVGSDGQRASQESFVGNTGFAGLAIDINAAQLQLKSDRINLYLNAAYSIHPRWRLGAGIQSAYFRKAVIALPEDGAGVISPITQGVNNAADFDLYNQEVAFVSYDLSSNSYSSPVEAGINRWQWSANSNLQYMVNRNCSVQAQYQYHLTSWPDKQHTYGGLHAVQLGFRYYLR